MPKKHSKSKKNGNKKIPYVSEPITIYGIFHIKSKKVIKVDLNEADIIFEFDLSMYDAEEYSIIRMHVSF
jgi:hypothetical protein